MNNTVGFILAVLVIAAIYQFFVAKPKYRIRLIDPVTSHIRYVLSVDGINNTYEYTASSKSALITSDLPRAERMLATMPDHTNAVIEVKQGFIPWKKFDTEG